jgi:hypothetical protein
VEAERKIMEYQLLMDQQVHVKLQNAYLFSKSIFLILQFIFHRESLASMNWSLEPFSF